MLSMKFVSLSIGVAIASLHAQAMESANNQLLGVATETLVSKERNEFVVPSAAALLDPQQPHGLNLAAVDLRYDILIKRNYFNEMGYNKEDISVDIRNLRQLQTRFSPSLEQAKPYLKYLRTEYPQIIQNKAIRLSTTTTFAELVAVQEEIRTCVEKFNETLLKLTHMNINGIERSLDDTKTKILKVLGQKAFPLKGVTHDQLDLLPRHEGK